MITETGPRICIMIAAPRCRIAATTAGISPITAQSHGRRFTLGPMLMALIGSRNRDQKRA
jgi:hypothetical protein